MSPDDPRQKLLNVLDPLIEDIMSMSDEDIIAETTAEGRDPALVAASVAAEIAAATAAAGKLRLAAARAQLDGVLPMRSRPRITSLAPAMKEQVLAQFAANDLPLQQRLTMAARNGDTLTQEEIDTILLDLVELGAIDDQGNIK